MDPDRVNVGVNQDSPTVSRRLRRYSADRDLDRRRTLRDVHKMEEVMTMLGVRKIGANRRLAAAEPIDDNSLDGHIDS